MVKSGLFEGVGGFVLVKEGVELPSMGGGVGFAVGRDVVRSFEIGIYLRQGFGCRFEGAELLVRIGECRRVPFLAWRLIRLVGLFACASKNLTCSRSEKVNIGVSFHFSVQLTNGVMGNDLWHKWNSMRVASTVGEPSGIHAELLIKNFVPLCELTQAFADRGVGTETEISLESGGVCKGDGNIAGLHRDKALVRFEIVVGR